MLSLSYLTSVLPLNSTATTECMKPIAYANRLNPSEPSELRRDRLSNWVSCVVSGNISRQLVTMNSLTCYLAHRFYVTTTTNTQVKSPLCSMCQHHDDFLLLDCCKESVLCNISSHALFTVRGCYPPPILELEDNPLSSIRHCLFSIFTAALHSWRPFLPSSIWERHTP
jgi:hypothetical protein